MFSIASSDNLVVLRAEYAPRCLKSALRANFISAAQLKMLVQ